LLSLFLIVSCAFDHNHLPTSFQKTGNSFVTPPQDH
jgi:hypothetical protein